MSYILDALQKSENERKNQDLPDLNALHHRPVAQSTHKSKIWPIALVAILLLNIGGFWYIRDSTPVPQEAAIPIHDAEPEMQPVAENRVNPVTNPAEAQAEVNPVTRGLLITPQDAFRQTETVNNKPGDNLEEAPGDLQAEPVIEEQNRPVSRITALPTNIQRQIPDLRFSSHLYADDRSFRMVNINGNMFHEGDMIAEGIRLERISEAGVVLSYLHYTFEISVIRDWSYE